MLEITVGLTDGTRIEVSAVGSVSEGDDGLRVLGADGNVKAMFRPDSYEWWVSREEGASYSVYVDGVILAS